MSDQAEPTVFIDNPRTRVTQWRFDAGAATGWHRHEYDYVVVPVMDGRLRIVTGPDEESFAELRQGVPYFREAGVEHDVFNASGHEFAFVEVEFKTPRGAAGPT